jgi:RNA polymerase sigma factor (sigma-70 family)
MTVGKLVGRAAAGDELAWADLVEQYSGLLRAIAARFRLASGDAEDAAQMTWMGLFQNVNQLRAPEGTVGWLATTMRRNCMRVVNQRRHEQLCDDWAQWSVTDEEGPLDAGVLVAERNRILWEAVDRLPERQRQLLRNLFATDERSYGEIAAAMSTSVGTIGPARRRALRHLGTLLAEAGVGREHIAA